MSVRFFGPMGNTSGYGNASTNFAKAFSLSKIPTKFSFALNNYGQKILKELDNYTGNTKIDFYLHGPPYDKHKSRAYKIGYFYWEADKLPKNWNRSIHGVNELWVPCQLVKDACLKSKFTGPIKIIPTPCEAWDTENLEPLEIPAKATDRLVLDSKVYKFYSIFQWHHRKGFANLLNAYYKAFGKNDQVILILKVNALNVPGYYADQIRPDILEIKRKLNLEYYPPVYLSSELVPVDVVKSLHVLGDCYVSPHHGEGWGMPIHDAMRLGKQVIVTRFGGVTEYLDDNSAHIIKHNLGPVTNMEWSPLYGSYQNWAYPSVNHLTLLMREVYLNHQNYQDRGEQAKKIANTMTIEKISEMIYRELKGGR